MFLLAHPWLERNYLVMVILANLKESELNIIQTDLKEFKKHRDRDVH